MGTPHLGSDLARTVNPVFAILKRLTSIAGFGVNMECKLIECLKSNSRELLEIARSFTPRIGGIREIVSCVEEHVMPGVTKRVSGIPGSPSSHNP